MKIQKIDQTLTESAARAAREGQVQQSAGVTAFSRHLSELSQGKYVDYLTQLMGGIAEQGERMAKRAALSEFHRYREMIRKLLDETVSNGFAFHKYRKFDTRGRNKTFAIIQCINDKLDEMLKMLLAEEADHIALLSTVEDIRGMLVDMLL
ncbi:MAG: YaaR family protein [Candidatus Pelethousia sp.]|nr:YaaR family protein [Candidatus Pelethousia sp.]